jgi:hypothetical protein
MVPSNGDGPLEQLESHEPSPHTPLDCHVELMKQQMNKENVMKL